VFKEFWEKSSREFEDMGEFIRESIDEWLRHKKEASRSEKGTTTEK
jgi:Arc/MetJ-type ribon-helix-helix transcriptional regulator